MANRFWVGGGSANTWAATGNTNWGTSSGAGGNASVPGASDLAIFDSNSPAGTGSVISANITVQGLDCTGGTGDFAFTITHNSAITLTINTGAASSLRFSAGMTYTPVSQTTTVTFTHTSGTANITCAGKKFSSVTINGAGGTTSPLDAFLCNANFNGTALTLTSGTFDANNQTVTAGTVVFSANNTRTLTMGSGLWTIGMGHTSAVTIWSCQNTGTLTFNKNTANIEVAGSCTFARTFITGAQTYNNLSVDANSSGGSLNISISGATVAQLNVTGPNTIALPNSGTLFVTTAPTWTGIVTTPIALVSASVGGAATLSIPSGTMSLDWGVMRDITATGGASFVATNTLNLGQVAGWSISSPAVTPTAAQIATAVWTDTTAGDFTTSLSVGKSVMNGVTLGTGLTVNDISTKTGYALSATGSAALTESYAADGAAPTLNQAIYEIKQFLTEKNISGTTLTTKKLDGSTTAATYTLDSAAPAPASITRTT